MFDGNGINRWSLGQVISCQGIKADTRFHASDREKPTYIHYIPAPVNPYFQLPEVTLG